MKEIAVILVSAILVNNFVLSKFLGVCSFLGVSKAQSRFAWHERCGYLCYGARIGGYIPY